jgi:putative transcriptional regulator
VQALRNKSLGTRLLLLHELLQRDHGKLATIADALDITVQAVSEYMRKLEEEGLASFSNGAYRPGTKGIQFLHDHFLELETWVRDSMRTLRIVQRTLALAGTPVAEGDAVGLFMENGRLVAKARADSPSKGVALTQATSGDAVLVGDLNGIVALKPGRITVLKVPPPGQTSRATIDKVKAAAKKDEGARVAALDAQGFALAARAGLRVEFEFGAAEAALDAAVKGCDVLAIGTEESAPLLVAKVEERNAALAERIVVRTTSL